MKRALKTTMLTGLLVFLVVLALGAGVALAIAWKPLGKAPGPARAEQMAASPQAGEGGFVNPQPMLRDTWAALEAMTNSSDYSVPEPGSIPVAGDTAQKLAQPAPELRLTWLGHSTTLIEIEGVRVLTDPVFGPTTSPFENFGPKRWYEPPLPLGFFRDVDVVLISHDHYDHLDYPTIVEIAGWDMPIVAPLGVGAHLEYWGVSPSRIIEVDWWDELKIGELTVAAVPSRHASGRHVFDQNRTLWTGYALIGKHKRVMFSGDTGMFDDLSTIGERYGPFDLVMIEIGAYNAAWPDWHMGPEQAVVAHRMLRGDLFVPIHWGLFDLAAHGWTEPMERLWVAAEKAGMRFATPRPGDVIDVDRPPAPDKWWPDVPWKTAAEAPIIATRAGHADDRYRVAE